MEDQGSRSVYPPKEKISIPPGDVLHAISDLMASKSQKIHGLVFVYILWINNKSFIRKTPASLDGAVISMPKLPM